MNTHRMTLRGHASARKAAHSSATHAAARCGFAARGVIYVLVGLLALQMAFGETGQQADRGGALAELAEKPMGSVLLWALGAGLVGMAVWRLTEALFGAAGPDGHKTTKRLSSAARCVFYAFVAYSVLAFAAGDRGSGSGSSDQQSQDVTTKVLDLPAGQWLVGAAGIGIAIAGIVIGARAVARSFHKHLRLGEMTRRTRQVVDITGVAGGAARGIVFTAVGVFVVRAAVTYRPDEAKGVDDTLRSFADTPVGPWLLVAVAVGLALFGVFSFAMARWRRL